MAIIVGKTEGEDALFSGTPNNPQAGARPVGWNVLEPQNVPALVELDTTGRPIRIVTPDGQGVGGSGSVAVQQAKPFNHTLIDFQFPDAATGWSTGANHSVSYDAANKGLRIRGSGVSGTNIITTKTLPRTLSPSQVQRVAVKFRSNTPGLQAGMYVQFGDGTTWSSVVNTANLFEIPNSDTPEWHWAVFNTSEDSAWATLPTITQMRFRTNGQSAPFLNDVTISRVVINPQTVSPVCWTFDDGWDTARTIGLPMLRDAGMVGTVFLPAAGAPGVASNRRLSAEQCRELEAAGWAICLDGTDDDSVMTAAASPEAAMGKFLNGQLLGTGLGTSRTNLNYLCYPNGSAWATGSPVQIASATSNGTTTVTLGAAATIANGSAYYAANAPDGTTVVTGGTNVTSITVSNPIPAGTIAAAAVDLSSQFSYSALTARLASAGVRGARLTGFGDASVIEGLLNPLAIAAVGFTGTNLNSATTLLTRLKNRGVAIIPYIHETMEDPVGWTPSTNNASINVYRSFQQGIVDLIKSWRDAGEVEVMTFPAMVERYRN